MTNEKCSFVAVIIIVVVVAVVAVGAGRWKLSQAPIPSQDFQKVCAAMVVFLEYWIGVVKPE